jgi:hypothetical protein
MIQSLSAVQGESQAAMTTIVYQKRQTYATAALSNLTGHLDRFAWGVASSAAIGATITSPVAIASSTAVNPSVITTGAVHGLTTGDTVAILGHAGNTALNGGWIATVLTTTTFSVPTLGVAAGTATGTVTKQPTDNDVLFTVNSLISDFAGVTGTE